MTEAKRFPIRASDLLGLRQPIETALSPDGRRVVCALAEPDFGKSEVRVQLFEMPGFDPAPAGDPPAEERQLTYALEDAERPEFAPDGSQLAFVTFRPQPHEEEEDDRREDGGDKRQVFLLPTCGGEARRFTEAAEGVEDYCWWPDGSGIAFIGQAPRSAAERATRRRRKEAREDQIVAYSDRPEWEIWFQPLHGRPRRLLGGLAHIEEFDISPDGKWLLYTTNHSGLPQDREKVAVILRSLETGSERPLTRGRGGAESTPCFTRDGRFALFHGWSDPAYAYGRQELFAVALDDPQAPIVPLLAVTDRDLEEFVPLADGTALAIVAEGFYSRLVRLAPAQAAATPLPIEGWVLRGLSVSADGTTAAVIAENGSSPPEVATIDLTATAPRLRFHGELNPEQADWQRGRREVVRWTNEGFEHEGLLVLPATPPKTPPPLLVWLHGGPHWRACNTLRLYEAEALAAEGWAVFAPQYRGSSGYGEAYALAIRHDLGGADARDVIAGVDELVRRQVVDANRIAVGGASYGGYLTNWLLASSTRFHAGISMMGIFDFHQDYSTSEYESWELHYLGGYPWERAEIYRERSPMSIADRINAPVLILHGLDDENTPVGNSKALYRALKALGRTTELVLYPREGHGLHEPQHRLDAYRRMSAWLTEHLLGRAPLHDATKVVRSEQVALQLLNAVARHDYAGLRPTRGRAFYEIAFVLRATEGGPTSLRVTPAGPDADVVLRNDQGDLFRPIGVPLDVSGQSVLFDGRGYVEAVEGDDARPPVLPVACVFELPDIPAIYRLQVATLPPITLDVEPTPDDEDDAD